ncbi:MAG: O-antigen ligase family protein [Vicinamibacterales bacterium]
MPRGRDLWCGAVLAVGLLAWLFPGRTADVAGPWALPALALLSAALSVIQAARWSRLQLSMGAFGVVLVMAWLRDASTSTAHFAGAALGMLTMTTVGSSLTTIRRLAIAVAVFLLLGTVVHVVGIASLADWRHYDSWLVLVATAIGVELPPLTGLTQLGLAGVSSGGVNPNALAGVVLLFAPLAVVLLWEWRVQQTARIAVLAAALLTMFTGVLTLAITSSRMAAVSVWLLLVGALVYGRQAWPVRVCVGALVVLPVLVISLAPTVVGRDVFAAGATSAWDSADSRRDVMSQAVTALSASPWLGIGINSFRKVYRVPQGDQSDPEIAHAHNIFLQTALDLGIPGAVVYWVMVVGWVRLAFRTTRSQQARVVAVGAASSLLAIHLFGLGDAVALGAKVGLLQWTLAGFILAAADLPDGG